MIRSVTESSEHREQIKEIVMNLHKSFVEDDYKGWDLYDALLSKYYKKGSIFDSFYPRYIWTQVNKRAPINLRPLMRVPKSLNPKGLSLILRGYCKLYGLTQDQTFLDSASSVYKLIVSLRSESDYYCWGNNFDYQARNGFHPAFTPNAITTSFVANSIVDYYLITKDQEVIRILESIRSYYLETMLLFSDERGAAFRYYKENTPITYNSSAKSTETLALINAIIPDSQTSEIIKMSYSFLLKSQNDDGSWYYSSGKQGQWIDNFHTGYVLVALKHIREMLYLDFGQDNIDKGLRYHLCHHYTKDHLPRYYTGSLYPIDTHCFAQSIITLSEFSDFARAGKMAESSIKHMYNFEERFFIYSIRKHYTVRTNLLRWCNAYMFYALSLYLSLNTNQLVGRECLDG